MDEGFLATAAVFLTCAVALVIIIGVAIAGLATAARKDKAKQQRLQKEGYIDPTYTQRVGGYLYHTGKIGPPRI